MELHAEWLHVHYGQAYVLCGDREVPDLEDAFRGQANGLCGASALGALFLLTGLHTGKVGFAVQVLDAAEDADQSWEDIVEVPFSVPDLPAALYEWGEAAGRPLPLTPGTYRARYCARGMDAGHRQDTVLPDEDAVDEYLLQFWPAEPGGDQVIKETSETAGYWHNFARRLGPAGSPTEPSARSDNAAGDAGPEGMRRSGPMPGYPGGLGRLVQLADRVAPRFVGSGGILDDPIALDHTPTASLSRSSRA